MAIQHKNIADADRHEPKGATTATVNQVYASDGAGSGTWTKIKSPNLQGVAGDAGSSNNKIVTDGGNGFVLRRNAVYGTMAITGNTNAFVVAAAADATLNTNSDYVLFTGTGAPWASENLKEVTFTTNRLTVPVTGLYKIDMWSTIIGWPGTSSKISVKHRINGGTFSTRHPMARTPATVNDPGELTGFGHISLSANDFVQLYVASSAAGNLIFSDLNITLTLVDQTA